LLLAAVDREGNLEDVVPRGGLAQLGIVREASDEDA
jgi:hypothetical protein